MSIDYTVYIGPYLKIPKVTYQAAQIKTVCSRNDKHQVPYLKRFCPDCGAEIVQVSVTKQVQNAPQYYQLEDTSAYVEDLLYSPFDGVWVPNKTGWGQYFSIKECDNFVVEHCSAEEQLQAITKMTEQFKDIITAFHIKFGNQLTVKYGTIYFAS